MLGPTGKIRKIFLKTETNLVLFFAYLASLVYLLITKHGWVSVLTVHLFFVILFSILYFFQELLLIFFSPVIAVIQPILNYQLSKYLKNFKQNIPAEVVIILARYDWFKLEAWIKNNFLKSEIKALVHYLEAKKQDFSFYPNASFEDVEEIMSNKEVREVYFFGHGDSHMFQLNTDQPLYYCDFKDQERYGKEFVHQVHCGTPYGKSLVDYVVSKENRDKCFFFRKPINSFDIEKEFKRRTENF